MQLEGLKKFHLSHLLNSIQYSSAAICSGTRAQIYLFIDCGQVSFWRVVLWAVVDGWLIGKLAQNKDNQTVVDGEKTELH